jgi:hypothetical protein
MLSSFATSSFSPWQLPSFSRTNFRALCRGERMQRVDIIQLAATYPFLALLGTIRLTFESLHGFIQKQLETHRLVFHLDSQGGG